MKRSTFLILAAILYGGFGLGLFLIPDTFMTTFCVTLDAGGVLMARILGAALTGFALVIWWSRNDADSSTLRALLRASCIYNLLDLPVVLLAVTGGVMNGLGWSTVALHLLLALGFGYFGFVEKA